MIVLPPQTIENDLCTFWFIIFQINFVCAEDNARRKVCVYRSCAVTIPHSARIHFVLACVCACVCVGVRKQVRSINVCQIIMGRLGAERYHSFSIVFICFCLFQIVLVSSLGVLEFVRSTNYHQAI